MVLLKPHTGWLGLAVSIFAICASAKDLQVTFWNSSDCSRRDPSTESYILQIPRDHDDPNLGVTCSRTRGDAFDGWYKDTHSQDVFAYVDNMALRDDCELVFYTRGPRPDQPSEEIAVGPCWQGYRRISGLSSCPSVNFNPKDFALSYCCGASCHVPWGALNVSDPVFPAAPPSPNLLRDTSSGDTASSMVPIRRNSTKKRSDDSSVDLTGCKFNQSTELRTTYLPTVQIDGTVTCGSALDFGGAPCPYTVTFNSEVSFMSSKSLSVSESIQFGIEGILSSTTTVGWEGSTSSTNGQSISSTQEISLPQGRVGFPAFKQVVQCVNGTFTGCKNADEILSLPNQEYCLPKMEQIGGQAGNPIYKAVGIMFMVDTT
ncbi:hypothetical protein F4818DRAFT_442484 [Hypoxylon cercidicola]|nr:hypothetical protein F4818DRAFT_442484 [Hypoxylon cercidicola]